MKAVLEEHGHPFSPVLIEFVIFNPRNPTKYKTKIKVIAFSARRSVIVRLILPHSQQIWWLQVDNVGLWEPTEREEVDGFNQPV